MKYNNRLYCKIENVDFPIIKIKNEIPNQNEPKFVLGSFNSTKEARDYVKSIDQVYTFIVPDWHFYEKDDFIFSNNLLDVYKHLYKRITSRLIITRHLSTESVIMFLLYFYCIYLLKKDNYYNKYDEINTLKVTNSDDPSKVKLLKIFSEVKSKEPIVVHLTELNKLIEEMASTQSIEEVITVFQKQVKLTQFFR
jgi:hypothetical protein